MILPLLFVLFCIIKSDNIQIRKESFNKIRIGTITYSSSTLEKGSLFKISYPGFLIYKLEEESPMHFVLIDKTVYLDKEMERDNKNRYFVIVEEVFNEFYVSKEIIKLVLVLVNLALLGLILFGYILPSYLDTPLMLKRE